MLRARLTVTSNQEHGFDHGLGPNATHDFDTAGGIIGRSGTCDWCLPDPSHTLSARHAEVRFNGHGFVVVDLSTNGVYVNTTDAPLGRGNAAVLVNGDLLYLGTYVIAVEMVRAAPAPAPIAPTIEPLPSPQPAPAMARPVIPRRPGGSSFAGPASTPMPSAFAGGLAATRDPLAALDGASLLQEADNPFSDLGIGQRDGEGTDTDRRALMSEGSLGDFLQPQRYPPPNTARPLVAPPSPATPAPAAPAPAAPAPIAPAPASPAPTPAAPLAVPVFPRAPAAQPAAVDAAFPFSRDTGFAAPPAFAPPAAGDAAPPASQTQDAPANAPVGQGAAAVIPPNFLDELSILIPRLVNGEASENAPATPAPAAPPVPNLLDDPEERVTLLRMRGKGKATPVPPASLQPVRTAPPTPEDMPAPPMPASAVPLPQPSPQIAPQPPAVAAQAATPSEGAFWALLGIDAARLSEQERGQVLGEVAGLLRTLVEGVLTQRDAQRRQRGELRVDDHRADLRAAAMDNPFSTALTPHEALARALGGRGEGRPFGAPAPATAARAVIEEMARHEAALVGAMHGTIANVLERISPAAIAFDVEDEGPSNGIFARKADKAKLWDRYLMMHERLIDALDVVALEQMGREFARSLACNATSQNGEDA